MTRLVILLAFALFASPVSATNEVAFAHNRCAAIAQKFDAAVNRTHLVAGGQVHSGRDVASESRRRLGQSAL